MRPLVDSSITVIKVKVFKERPARTFLPRLVHSLFPYLVSLCEAVNSSFVLRASAVEPRSSFLWTNCPIMVYFFPMKMVVRINILYVPICPKLQ